MMILMKSFPLGRLGNNLFQLAFIRALSERTRIVWMLPKWKYEEYFQIKWNLDTGYKVEENIIEFNFDYNPVFKNSDPINSINYYGYWQSEKYFDDQWDKIKNDFKFKKEFLDSIFERTDFRPSKKDYAVHVRLGDYVNNSEYINIPSFYYRNFFKETDKEFYVFTDDHELCKKMLGLHDNVQYVEGNTDIEDLALMSQFYNLIISNSSFPWWASKISEIYHKKVNVIRPDCLFNGNLAKSCHANDFYPSRWKCNPLYPKIKNGKSRIDLKDVTFVISIKNDHNDRIENINLVIMYLKKYFDTNIIIGEQGGEYFKYLSDNDVRHYTFSDMVQFHRTKVINEMVKLATTDIVFSWDADIIINIDQIVTSVKKLKYEYDFIYPYDGCFVHISRDHIHEIEEKIRNNKLEEFEYFRFNSQDSKGGVIGFKKKSYIEAGMENENFEKYGFEDNERYERFKKLGYKIDFISGVLLHLDHFRGKDSQIRNSKIAINKYELRKIKEMSVSQLKSYINTWDWCKF